MTEEKQAIDYKNPGLNDKGGRNLKIISEKSDFFKLKTDDDSQGSLDATDIYRFAVSIAIARDLKLPKKVRPIGSHPDRPNGMSWAQQSLDKPSSSAKMKNQLSLVDLVQNLCDDPLAEEAPWAYIELLAHAGLEELVKDIKEKKMLSEII
jgi:hypothetical protein